MDKKAKITLIVILFIAAILLISVAVAKRGGKGGRAKKECRDKIDNDGDGLTDWPSDPGCANKNDNSELNPAIECDDGSDCY